MVKLLLSLFLFTAWEKVTESDGVTVERRKVEGFDVYEVRATVRSKYAPKQVFDVIWNHKEYPQFVPYLKKANILSDDGTNKLIYEQLSMPVVSDRDYTVQIKKVIDEGAQLYQVQFSSSDKGPPPSDGLVRVQRIRGGWTVEPNPAGGSDVTYVVLSDPGGSIPTWISNSAQKDAAPNFLKAMMKRVGEKAK